MAFAIILNTDDLAYFASQLTRPDLDDIDRTNAVRMWDGGMRNWSISPQPTYELRFGDNDTRIVKINSGTMSSKDFSAAMRRMALVNNLPKYPATNELADSIYMDALADGMNPIEPYNG